MARERGVKSFSPSPFHQALSPHLEVGAVTSNWEDLTLSTHWDWAYDTKDTRCKDSVLCRWPQVSCASPLKWFMFPFVTAWGRQPHREPINIAAVANKGTPLSAARPTTSTVHHTIQPPPTENEFTLYNNYFFLIIHCRLLRGSGGNCALRSFPMTVKIHVIDC